MVRRLSAPVLVGREREFERLRSAYDGAEGAAVLVQGEAGIGKSRLVAEFGDWTRERGARVLSGGCLPFSTAVPYAPFSEILRRLGTVVSRADPAGFDLGERTRYFAAVAEALTGGGPTVVVVEDLHWADRSTGDLFLYLVQALRPARVLLVGTWRTDEHRPAGRLAAALGELTRSGRVERIELPRLDPGRAAELVRGIGAGSDPELVRRIVARAEGNPFFTEELLAVGGGELPPTIGGTLRRRIGQVEPNTQQVLRAASVAGRQVRYQLLRQVSGLSLGELDLALREAVGCHLLVASSGGYSFRHALTHELVYGDLLPGERQRLHERIAVVLTEHPAYADGVATAELARHWALADRPAEALAASIAAGLAAERAQAPAEAFEHYRLALELWPRVDAAEVSRVEVLQRAAEVASFTGRYDVAVGWCDELLAEMAPSADRSLVLERKLRYLRYLGRADAARQAARELARQIPAEPSQARARTLCALAASAVFLDGRPLDGVPLALQALDAARAAGARFEEGYALLDLGMARVVLGCHDESIAALQGALAIARETAHPHRIVVAWYDLAAGCVAAGRAAEGVAHAEAGLAEARQLGLDETYGPYLAGALTFALLATGDWDRADAVSADAPTDPDFFAALLQLARAQLLIRRGAFAAAARLLDAVEETTQDHRRAALLCARRAELALWQCDPDTARAAVRRGLDGLAGTQLLPLHLELVALGNRVADCGLAAVEALLAEVEDSVGVCSLPYRRILAVARAELGDGSWARVVEQAGSDRYLAAYAGWRQASSLLVAGARDAAGGVLRSAYRDAVTLGAEPLAAEIRALAARGRVVLDPARPDPRLGLTPREQQVLDLLAQGRSNAEIGAALFISTKTVSAHVTHILRKLGVPTRGRAAAIAHRHGR